MATNPHQLSGQLFDLITVVLRNRNITSDIDYTTLLRFFWKNKRIAQKTHSFLPVFSGRP
jgi:hypothetical protein